MYVNFFLKLFLFLKQEKIRLKFKITYSKDSETYSDVGEIDDFANNWMQYQMDVCAL